jgi:DNA uptake protein ComE-like DNA-binding protein
MFVYKASVMKIVANRDEPDTVYVYDTPKPDAGQKHVKGGEKKPVGGVSSEKSSAGGDRMVVRKNAPHSPRAEAVRRNLPRRKVESFSFDPNTVSEEGLCRLGFTQKQAQSIVNYRQKGGRFRRKEDFAKSFVVSDSIYRRLEAYIDIPQLDLNLADSAAFDALPGIGGWFAKKMIDHRKALGGYSYKEQLMDIWKFDRQKYDALSDLVTVSHRHVTPYPLWTYPADSLKMHPYIRNYETARAIVLFRENTPPEQCTVEALEKAGILVSEYACRLSQCVISTPVRSSESP